MEETSATELPSESCYYRSTPMFTETTVPAALLRDHHTKDGVWGLIRIHSGCLRYTISDPRRSPTCVDLTPVNSPAVVEPTIFHSIEPIGPVQFQVDFYR